MIEISQLIEIGKFNKPHGINGEIVATISDKVDIDKLGCIILAIDGIFVPFFIEELRSRSQETILLKIDGVESDSEARELTNKTIYLLLSDDAYINSTETDGMYASDFIGFTIFDMDEINIGRIVDIEDSTENALFVIEAQDESIKYIPIADDLIEEIMISERIIKMSLPQGLLDL